MEKGGRKKNHKVVITATASGIQARQNWKFDSKCLRETSRDKGWIFFFFQRCQQKLILAATTGIALLYSQRGFSIFVLFSCFCFKKSWENGCVPGKIVSGNGGTWETKQTNNNKWLKRKTGSLCPLPPSCGWKQKHWEVRSIGKGKASGLSPGYWAREWGFPKEEEGKKLVPEGGLCADKVGQTSWWNSLFREKWLILNQVCHQS